MTTLKLFSRKINKIEIQVRRQQREHPWLVEFKVQQLFETLVKFINKLQTRKYDWSNKNNIQYDRRHNNKVNYTT